MYNCAYLTGLPAAGVGGSSSTVLFPPVGRGVPGVVQGRGREGETGLARLLQELHFPSSCLSRWRTAFMMSGRKQELVSVQLAGLFQKN